jgi:hypothetical protein
MINNKLSCIILVLLLTGCGGGGSDSPPPVVSPSVNNAPVLVAIDNLTTYSNVNKAITLNATDPDGDVLTFEAVSSVQGVVLELKNTQLVLNATNDFYGTADISVTVSDGELSDSSSFTIEVLQASAPPAPSSVDSQLSIPPTVPSF